MQPDLLLSGAYAGKTPDELAAMGIYPGGVAPATASATPPTSTTPPTSSTPTVGMTTSTGTQTQITPPSSTGLSDNGFMGVLNNLNNGLQQNNTLVDQKNAVLSAMMGNPVDPTTLSKLPPDIQSMIQSGNRNALMLQAQVLNDALTGKNASVASSIQFLTTGYEASQTRAQTELNNLMTFATNNGYQIGDLVKAMSPILGGDLSATLAKNLQALGTSPYVKSSLTPNIMGGGATGQPVTLSQAITAQEGGTYTTVNPSSGALGKYQIMPAHLADLTNPTTGQPLDPNNPQDVQMFLNTPALQDQLFNQLMSQLQTKYAGDEAKQIAAYYGGDGAAAIVGTPAGDKPQGAYPSINQYVADVQSRMTNAGTDFSQSGLQKMGIFGQEIQSWVNNIANGTVTSVAQVPAGLKTYVSMARSSQGVSSPLADSRFTIASNRIVSNYIALPGYSLVANGLPYLGRIAAAMTSPGSVSDQDLLDSLTKLNTSGNAITDAQVSLITNGKSFSDSVAIWGQKLGTGGVLSSDQRQQVVKIANAIYANYAKEYQPIYDQVTSQLTDAQIPKQFWTIPDLNALAEASGLSIPGVTDSGGGSGAQNTDPLGLGI